MAPASMQKETTARGVVPDDGGRASVKSATFPTAGLSFQERRLLRKRTRSELEVVHGLLKKKEMLVNSGAAPSKPRPATPRGKNGRLLPAEAQPKADAKKRKKSPLVEVIEPRMSKVERDDLGGRLRLLSEELPPHIVEFMQRQCSSHVDLICGDLEVNLYTTGDAAMFQLKKLLDRFVDERKQQLVAEKEDCNLAEQQEEEDVFVDICGDASPVVVHKVPCSSPLVRHGEAELVDEDEFVDICGDASPVAIERFSEVCNSSGSSSSGSSGSCCSDSSDSISDSDDDDIVSSSPAPTVLPVKPAATAASTAGMSHLLARAKMEKRNLDRQRAREKLQEMERMATPSDDINPMDMLLLGLVAVEHVVSSGSGDEMSPVERVGFFLKADDFSGDEEEDDIEIEEGEIVYH